MKATLVLALLPALLLLPGQDPQRPASQPASRPSPPGGFPGLPPQAPAAPLSPAALLPGAWELRRLVAPGAPPGVQVRGYVLFSRAPASFQAVVQEGQADPLLQCAFWRYTASGSRLRFQSLLGVRTDTRGRMHTETPGSIEERLFECVGGTLRLHRGRGSYLELVRLE